ncbi:ATP-binding domain-containing protein [Mycolicibacterium goodii]|uniref:DEAD/DEAH box helicase n=1 Tax=Mycolicibacterium goodii TaxID=134601 RepID=UPI001F040CAE|nr:ATP-binding domain-containing protein [Mycolicibacterium goodii]ULN49107.1 ATP-binding domain-containing protein [Mycolicibacterium goodii]
MAIEIIRGTTTKPAATEELIRLFQEESEVDGQLIIGFPNLGGQIGEAGADALWLSATFGPVLFDLVEGTSVGDFAARQDDLFRLFHGRLFNNRGLVKDRHLIVDVQVVTFAPRILDRTVESLSGGTALIANRENLFDVIGTRLPPQNLDGETFDTLLSAAQSISSIRRARQTRVTAKADSRGARLLKLESSISTLDNKQHHAVIETIDGVQRIRGLAGSGKTIILALKAAYLHGRHPTWTIAVTFYTRSLKEQFKQLITTFCVEQSGVEPDWERLHIINAWGGRGGPDRTGVYKRFCDVNGVDYFDLGAASAEFGKSAAFEGAVTRALAQAKDPQPVYDVILVDEAQDFPPEFLRMCYYMLGPERRLVYAYDELQSLTGDGLPDAATIFGRDSQGRPLVSFERTDYDQGARRDIVLEKCYRNSRPVLVSAHALGFGVYRVPRFSNDIGLVQIFEQTRLWHDIGYYVADGDLTDGHQVALARSPDSSPKFLEAHSPIEDLIQFHVFDSAADQNAFVADELERNLIADELRHDDVMVINPNPLTARANLGPLRKQLAEKGIDSHMAGVDLSADVFFAPGRKSITFTGIYRAKGNEAGMVYVVNAQEGNDSRANLAAIRNRLFTAITRSKAWVRVCGVGPEMKLLADEFARIQQSEYKLRFVYPTKGQREQISIVHREISNAEQEDISNAGRAVEKFIEGIQSGQLYKEDLPEGLLKQLRALLDDDQADG